MNDGVDVDDLNLGALDGAISDAFRRETSAKSEGQSESRIQSESASGPFKKTAGERGPEASVNNASVASPNQEIRTTDLADTSRAFKAHPSKDPISKSLASSEQSATQSGPDRRSIPVLSGEVSNTSSKTGPSPSVKETNSEQPRQRSDRDSQPSPIRADSAGSGSRENSGPKLLDKSLENGSPVNKAENLNKPSIPESSQLNSAGLPKISDVERSIKRNSDTESPDSSVGKSGNPGANSAPPS